MGTRAPGTVGQGPQMAVIGVNSAAMGVPPRANAGRNNLQMTSDSISVTHQNNQTAGLMVNASAVA